MSEAVNSIQESPYRERNSLIAQSFEMARAGVLIADLVRFVTQHGGNAQRILRKLRGCKTRGYEWTVEEKNGTIKVIYPKKS